MNAPGEMRRRILDVAGRLVQTRGYDGFSYADVARDVGIRKATIHHHFPTKGGLGRALVERFRDDCRGVLGRIDAEGGAASLKLDRYVALFEATLADGGRMCLCGMLAAGHETLPAEVKAELDAALAEHEAWLFAVVRDGQESGEFRADVPARTQAMAILSGLEGALLLARAHGDLGLFRAVAGTLTGGLRAVAQARA